MYYDIIPIFFSNLCWLDVRFYHVLSVRSPVHLSLPSIEGRSGARIDFKPMESSFTDEDIHEHIATWAFSGRAPKNWRNHLEKKTKNHGEKKSLDAKIQ